MGGISMLPTPGIKLKGIHGEYYVKNQIGHGGNGAVFAVDIINGDKCVPEEMQWAVKFLVVSLQDERELEKRRIRFQKEIEEVCILQEKVDGILPIHDSSIFCKKQQDYLWYLMPMAMKYEPRDFSLLEKLEQLLQLGTCIKALHDLGYAHRDIKPKNLLLYKNRMYLSDFGLVWNQNSTVEHITEVNDRLGPMAIRPPELQPVKNVIEIDYRKSDVYLFAKTVWMILRCNREGFSREYSRVIDKICFVSSQLQVETAEPLHIMMEGATKHNYWERISIDDCIGHIKDQINIIKGNIPESVLLQWKYNEKALIIEGSTPRSEIIYNDQPSILRILNELSGMVALVFSEPGKEYPQLPLRRANAIKDNIFELEVSTPNVNESNKSLFISIKYVSMEQDKSFQLCTEFCQSDIFERNVVCRRIDEVLTKSEKKIYLNGRYTIKLIQIQGSAVLAGKK